MTEPSQNRKTYNGRASTFRDNRSGSSSNILIADERALYRVIEPFEETDTITAKTTIDLQRRLDGYPALFVRVKVDRDSRAFRVTNGNVTEDFDTLKANRYKRYVGTPIQKFIIIPTASTVYTIYASTVSPEEIVDIVKTLPVSPTVSIN